MKNKNKIVDILWEKSKLRPDGKRELTEEQIIETIRENTDIPDYKIKEALNSIFEELNGKEKEKEKHI